MITLKRIPCQLTKKRPIGLAVTCSTLVRKSQADQIGHSVANGSPPLRNFFEKSYVSCRRNDVELSPANFLQAWAEYSEYNRNFDMF